MQFSISLLQPVGKIHLRCNAKVLFDVSTKKKKKNLFSFASGKTQQVTRRCIPWNKLSFLYQLRSLTLQLFIPPELYFIIFFNFLDYADCVFMTWKVKEGITVPCCLCSDT